MNLHARDIEPDLGPLLDLANDLPEPDASGYRRTEPPLEGDSRKKSGLAFGPMDRIGQGGTTPAKPVRRNDSVRPSGSTLLTVWGGFWRAVVIGVVSGTVGGVIGALTLVWLTGAGWTTFARLLIDAISGA